MGKLIAIFAALVLFFATTTSVFAAPSATVGTDAARPYVLLAFTGLRDVSKVNYVLTYDSKGLSRGFEGGIRPKVRTTRTAKRQILGTCSSGRCVYHKNPTNIQLDVTFTLKSGQTIKVTKTLP